MRGTRVIELSEEGGIGDGLRTTQMASDGLRTTQTQPCFSEAWGRS